MTAEIITTRLEEILQRRLALGEVEDMSPFSSYIDLPEEPPVEKAAEE